MNKLLFIDSSYRKKTKSVDFLLELLRKHYDVELFYIEEASPKEIKIKGREKYEAVIFLQLNPAYYINYFNNRNIVFIPMYDTFFPRRGRHLLFLKKIKWICFSEIFRPVLKNINCLFVKYYPELQPPNSEMRDRSFFFWQRRDDIDWNLIKKLLPASEVDSVNLHVSCDPGMEFVRPVEDDVRKYNIKFTSWFYSKEDFNACLSRNAYFFAPRGKEGIGLSFLDALGMGLVVIAPNDATMNEYITDSVNGYLYDPMNPKPIVFADYLRIRERSRNDTVAGRAAWEKDKYKIIDFINADYKHCWNFLNKSMMVSAAKNIFGLLRE